MDVIAASPTPAALAAKNATGTIPIVGISFDNPVQHGLVASLARPGGNVTGLSYSVGPEIFGKDLELLQGTHPRGSTCCRPLGLGQSEPGALHRQHQDRGPIAGSGASAPGGARARRVRCRFRGDGQASAWGHCSSLADPMFTVHRARLADLAVQNRLPSMYTNRPHVEAGGLMCYAPNFSDLWRRAATYVDKILKGAKPADLPVEQPTKFELVINLKTAKALGLTVPPSLLARADEVIE